MTDWNQNGKHDITDSYIDYKIYKDMEKIYFTIAGTKHHYGHEYFEPKMEVKLIKEPDNEFDKEAIKVEMDGLGLVGYVANSPYTVQGESMSAGRLYDRIGNTAVGVVRYVLPLGVLCELVLEKAEDEINGGNK